MAFGSWLFGHSISPLFQFSVERSMELFSGPIRVRALLFADAEAKDYEKVAAAVKDAAVKYRTQVGSGWVAGCLGRMVGCTVCWLVVWFVGGRWMAGARTHARSY